MSNPVKYVISNVKINVSELWQVINGEFLLVSENDITLLQFK